nr:hypothetical protein Iba_chr02fCG14090 [Ipomoea batatas]
MTLYKIDIDNGNDEVGSSCKNSTNNGRLLVAMTLSSSKSKRNGSEALVGDMRPEVQRIGWLFLAFDKDTDKRRRVICIRGGMNVRKEMSEICAVILRIYKASSVHEASGYLAILMENLIWKIETMGMVVEC